MHGARRLVLLIRLLGQASTLRLYLAVRISPLSETAMSATRLRAECLSPAVSAFRHPSERSIRPTSRPIPRRALAAGRRQLSSASMREGVDREGRHLYPAFPYDHYTLVTDEDSRAIYAFLMTRKAVSAAPPANELSFPFNMRMLLAGWKALYLREGPLQPDSNRSAEWNRGAILWRV